YILFQLSRRHQTHLRIPSRRSSDHARKAFPFPVSRTTFTPRSDAQSLKASFRPLTALPSRAFIAPGRFIARDKIPSPRFSTTRRSEEHTSELQSRENLVCRLLLEQK